MEEATSLLPTGACWLECEGTRAGETFLSLALEGRRVWLACDAFFNIVRPTTGPIGVIMRALKGAPGLSIGQTFKWLALKDTTAYRSWLLEALDRERPTEMWLSHGETVAGDDLPERLTALAKRRL
ncbi:MAG TPA: hypothetical protein VK762_33185 [Polyangiaceae bacterium]|nr:hypothetical protein [Polyangiaceae bacterium]